MKIYQIYYDNTTKNNLDPHFIPLESSSINANDFFEYTAIQKVLYSKSFDSGDYIGFFSPRFTEKTGLTGLDVINTIETTTSEIVSFSPEFPANVLFFNSIQQGEVFHNGLFNTTKNLIDLFGFSLDIHNLVQDQTRTIYSNYFVAKYSFWKEWFKYSEIIYNASSDINHYLYRSLNTYCNYRDRSDIYKLKVFIMERLVNLLLEEKSINAEVGLNFNKYLSAFPMMNKHFDTLIILDALKGQYINTRNAYYLESYVLNRNRFVEILNLYKN